MAKRRVGGIVSLMVSGNVVLEVRGSMTISSQETTREGVAGQDGVHGYTETPKVPYIEFDATTSRTIDVDAIDRMEDITATVRMANGQSYTLQEAWRADEGSVDAAQGQMPVRLEGMRGYWH